MSEVTTDRISRLSVLQFDELREANVERCEAAFHKIVAWNPLEWAGAMCGEAGEAANIAKKIRRLDEADAKLDTPKERKRLQRALANELADVVIYADLLAARNQIDLGKAVVLKFNKVSRKRGSTVLL